MRAVQKVQQSVFQNATLLPSSTSIKNLLTTTSTGNLQYLLNDTQRQSSLSLSTNYFAPEDATTMMQILREEVPWEWTTYKIDGKDVRAPRQMAWYADDPAWIYKFSKNHVPGLVPNSWHPVLLYIKNCVERTLGTQYNALLVNLYMNSLEHAYWHSDDDPWLGYPDPCDIASVSFGHTRTFATRPKFDLERELHTQLTHGSLCVMSGRFQEFYQHAVPPMELVCMDDYRINLTFRNVKDPNKGPDKQLWDS